MRPDNPVGLRNGLIEQKHKDAMGHAVWLYLWLVDRQTKGSDKILGGRPITYEMFAESFPDDSQSTYGRYIRTLRAGGYIATATTPYGLGITIIKAKKWKTGTSTMTDHSKKRYVKVDRPAKSKLTDLKVKVDRPNIRTTVRTTVRTTQDERDDDLKVVEMPDLDQPVDQLTSNELKPKSLRRDRGDINAVVFAFEQTLGVKLRKMAVQRNMAKHLIDHYQIDPVLKAIKAVALIRDERYAPQILDLQDLWEKWDKLGAYFRRKRKDQEGKVAVIAND